MSGRSLREIVHSAYSYVRSNEVNKSVAALTLDHLIQEQVARLKAGETRDIVTAEGASRGKRKSRYDEVSSLEADLSAAIASMKQIGNDEEKLRQAGVKAVGMEEVTS